MVNFKLNCHMYRTNSDASLIEIRTNTGWQVTDSDVVGAAKVALAAHNEIMARAGYVMVSHAPIRSQDRHLPGSQLALLDATPNFQLDARALHAAQATR